MGALEALFRHYARELSYLCLTHAPADSADVRLAEEEVVVGAIMAKCPDRRWRKSRAQRMREHAGQIVRDVKYRRRGLGIPRGARREEREGEGAKDEEEEPGREELVAALAKGWAAWDFGLRYEEAFGARSFGLIGLSVVCDMLEKLEKLDGKREREESEDEQASDSDSDD